MYNVIIFGTGKSSTYVENVLDKNVKILAYVDNNEDKWGQKKSDIEIIPPNNMKYYNYDYIIIASQFNESIYSQLLNMKIDRNRILQYSKIVNNFWNYYKAYINVFTSDQDSIYELLATGISYAQLGFNEYECHKKSFKFAFGSQDLFYDYHTIKYLIENFKDKFVNVKHVLIGLCYYSFQYDMSLSAMKAKTILYYEVLKNAHHFKDINVIYEEYETNKNIADRIFRKNSDGKYDFIWESSSLNETNDKEKIGKAQADMDCNKNYPETVKENTEIFKNYLQLLKVHNIKPIVVVYPASKYYTNHFSNRIEDEFHSIINEVKKEYDFQYIDYFRSELFSDEDFDDVSHLNWNGAGKFTKILNKVIKW